MSRRRRSRRTPDRTKRAVTRDVQREVDRFTRFSDLLDSDRYKNLYQDKRTFLWKLNPVERLLDGRAARIQASYRTRQEFKQRRVPSAMRFVSPRRVITCVRRKARREVLFAFKQTGKGSGARRRRYNESSHIKC